MFNVTYTQNGVTVTATVRVMQITPNNDRTAPQSVTLEPGIGGGGQLGKGVVVPIANITSITAVEV